MKASLLRALLLLTAGVVAAAINVGDKIPSGVALHQGFPPQEIVLADRIANKKVLLVGLPGAFTPT